MSNLDKLIEYLEALKGRGMTRDQAINAMADAACRAPSTVEGWFCNSRSVPDTAIKLIKLDLKL